MEGNSINSFENLCKIFEMRIKLDKEKHVKTSNDVIDNYEKYAKKIDNIYNKEFEKGIKGLISPEVTLEKEETRLKRLIKLLEDRLDKRRELEDRFYEATGKYIDGFQLVVSEEELEEKKNRLELISRYLTTKNEIDEINSSNAKLKNSLLEFEKSEDEYIKKNKVMEDNLYSEFVKSIKYDEYFNSINEDNYKSELSLVEDKVRENEETLEVTLDSVKSLMNSGTDDDYTSYVEDAEKGFYVWKNREIILKIYEFVISFEDDFEQMCLKRSKINDLLEDRKHIKNKLHIDDSDELLDFESLIDEQKNDLNKEREVLDNIINYNSRIKFKEERLSELEDIINSYEILTILREYGIIESYDIEDDKVEDVPEEITENIEEDNTSDEKESDEEVTGGLEDIVNDVIDPYRIKEVIDYPKTLNLGLAKLKGESVRESVNKKLNPKPRESIFDDFAKDTSEETPKEEVKVEDTTDSEADIQNTLTLPKIEVETPKEEVKSNDNTPLMWELPKVDDVKKVEETPNVPVWDVKPDFNSSTNNMEKKEEEIPKVDIDNQMVSNNAFWIPVSDSKLETKDFPNINIPLNNSNFSNEKDNFGFPDIN